MAKVFIGCVTYAKDEYALPLLLASLRKFTFPDWELHLVDTTPQTAPELAPYLPRLLQELKNRLPASRTVTAEAYEGSMELGIWGVVAGARSRLREQFLASDCTHLLFVDSDMSFPPGTIELLLSHDAPAVVGVYLSTLNHKTDKGEVLKRGPVGFITDPADPSRSRPLTIIDVMPPRVIRVCFTGFGCALLRRDVLERVPITYGPAEAQRHATDDVPFYHELDRLGVPVLMDTRVKCTHHKYPIGDARNQYLDFANYQIQVRQKAPAGK